MNTSQSTVKTGREFKILLTCDFLSSFGSCFLATAMAIFKYRELGNLLLASLFPMVAVFAQVFAFFINKHYTIKCTFRLLFFIGEILAGLFALSLFFIGNQFIPVLLLFSVFSIFFAVLEAYRAEFLKVITTNEEMPMRQSISRSINTAVVIVASLMAGLIADKTTPNNMYLITAVVYILPALIILFLSKQYKPLNQTETSTETAKSKGLTNKTFIFVGSAFISFFGGAASLLTLSYILNTLNSTAFHYSILISALSFGGVIGSLLINIPVVKNNLKKISTVGIFLVGGLLLLVVFKPQFIELLIILSISGILSAVSMTYYAISLFTLYDQSDIRKKYNLMQLVLQSSTAVSKPFAGIVERMFGIIVSFIICGVGFIFTAPINFLNRKKEKKAE
ncbi:MAG: hypothetical protein CR988_00625 [Treponema sp.]|nr:MAG: hypothetical protein CR988_00625 [Treponema sp.]